LQESRQLTRSAQLYEPLSLIGQKIISLLTLTITWKSKGQLFKIHTLICIDKLKTCILFSFRRKKSENLLKHNVHMHLCSLLQSITWRTKLQLIHLYIYFLCSASPISNSTQQIKAIKNIPPCMLGISGSEDGKRHHSLTHKCLFPLWKVMFYRIHIQWWVSYTTNIIQASMSPLAYIWSYCEIMSAFHFHYRLCLTPKYKVELKPRPLPPPPSTDALTTIAISCSFRPCALKHKKLRIAVQSSPEQLE